MKTTEHVECLLRQGRKPKELVELGFPKQVVTRVRRQLREEREPRKVTAKKVIGAAKDQPQPPAPSVQPPTRILEILTTLDAKYGELLDRLSAIEAVQAESVSLKDLEGRLDGTPALGLRHRFVCQCGELG
ncbi:MAG: hypothetical protein ISS55_10035 [Dehalococcoidales bacterium]|nr:hypothetical protein [Dehalococcoidales bacterium]